MALDCHLLDEKGIKPFIDLPDVISYLRAHVADLDLSQTYPTIQLIENISRETTVREMCQIKDLSFIETQSVGVNLTAGTTNALELCQLIFKMPTTAEIERLYLQSKA